MSRSASRRSTGSETWPTRTMFSSFSRSMRVEVSASPADVGEEDVELLALLDDRLAGHGDVVEDVEQVRRRDVVGVRDLGQQHQVLAERRQVGVDRVEVADQLVHRLAELFAAAPSAVARAFRVALRSAGRIARSSGNRSARILAELDVGLHPAGRDHVPVGERLSEGRSGLRKRRTSGRTASSAGSRPNVVGDLLGGRRLQRDVDLRLLAVLGDLAHLTDQCAVARTSPNFASCRPARSALTVTMVTRSNSLL